MNVTESGFKNRQLHMEDYLQMVSAEQKEYAEVFDYSKITEKSGVITDYWTNNLLDLILRKENLNKAYKQVKSNKGSGGIDGMQVDELLPYLRDFEYLTPLVKKNFTLTKNVALTFMDLGGIDHITVYDGSVGFNRITRNPRLSYAHIRLSIF